MLSCLLVTSLCITVPLVSSDPVYVSGAFIVKGGEELVKRWSAAFAVLVQTDQTSTDQTRLEYGASMLLFYDRHKV